MQPFRLDLDANSSSASKEWCHWFVTYENYVEVLDASLTGERRTNKLKALVNCISHRVFEYITDCDSYDEAITVLRNLYKRRPTKSPLAIVWPPPSNKQKKLWMNFISSYESLQETAISVKLQASSTGKRWFVTLLYMVFLSMEYVREC